jgi:muconate cycloisomerase
MQKALEIMSIESFIVDVPTIRPHVLAMATMRAQSMVLVRIHCSDGIDGIGEASTIGGLSYGEESPEGIKLAIDTYFAPVLLGCDPTRPADAMARLSRSIVGNHFAKCAIETALLDAMGKRVGLPISELLGGRIRDRLPVLWTLASGDTVCDIAEAKDMLERRRHNAFKLKIGKRPLVEDVAHVSAIKRAVGDRASIRVDVNQAWDEATAKRGLSMMADAGIDLVEQPIARANRAGMARLVALGRIPVMADEALRGQQDAFDFAANAAADIFAVKAMQAGGLTAAKTVGAIADAAGVALYGGTMLEGSIGTAASAHLFATFPTLAFGTELFGPLLQTEEILATPLVYEDFSLVVPDGAGLGITLDDEAVAAFRRDRTPRTSVSVPQTVGG